MIEIDPRAAADDRFDVAVLTVDVDVGAGVPVVLRDPVGADRADLLLVVFAERFGCIDDDRALVADLLATEIRFDGGEDVARADHDRAGLERLFLGVDALILGDRFVGGIDEGPVLDGAHRIREPDEVVVAESLGRFLGGLLSRRRLIRVRFFRS